VQSDLISESYRKEQAALHATGTYGTAALQFGELVSELVSRTKAKTLLDYGCGSKRSLASVLDCNVLYEGYDPAVPAFSAEPDPAEIVACIDVLEHIEPKLLDSVLDHIRSKTQRYAFLSIHCGPAVKTLSDGRNAHLIQEPPSWWLPKIMRRFDLRSFVRSPAGFWVTVCPGPTQN